MNSALKASSPVKRIRVLIVDDSRTICKFLEDTFSQDPGLDVVGYALDPYEAREKIKALKPDVLTLDVEMPKMDGITFLKNLMRLNPMPVVMFSSLTEKGTTVTFDALQAGAVDFMPKYSSRSGVSMEEYVRDLIIKVKSAGRANTVKPALTNDAAKLPDLNALQRKLNSGTRASKAIKRIIMIGCSTGGPEALTHVVNQLPIKDTAFVICQHMPANFMESFARRIDSRTQAKVAIAQDGELIQAGHGYVAQGDLHIAIEKRFDGFYWKVDDSEKVSGHRPSVNVLFNSAARSSAPHCIGVLLTGMGEDGATGLKAMRDAGSTTIIQDKESSVVWGMPGKAHAIGAQDQMLGLRQIGPVIDKIMSRVI